MNLVIGASGQVGHHLMKVLPDAVGTYCHHASEGLLPLDITDDVAVWKLVDEVHPDVIYLPAGQVSADYCEEHVAETDLVNIQGVLNVVHEAEPIGAKVVFFSSDYLFDGKDGAYSEDDELHPLNVYGRQKQIAEMIIRNEGVDHLIIRTSGVYSWEPQGKNFVMRLIKNLRSGVGARLPVDQIGSPTYAPHLAETVIELVNKGATGIYNVAGRKSINRLEFAHNVATVFNLEHLITFAHTDELNQIARRPLRGGLNAHKVEAFLGREMEDYLSGLMQMMLTETVTT